MRRVKSWMSKRLLSSHNAKALAWMKSWSEVVLVLAGLVHFLHRNWYNTAFWIQHEKNINSSLMFWLLISSGYSKSKNFWFSMLCKWAAAQESEKEHSQDRQDLDWPKGYSIPQCNFQNINWEEVARSHWLLLRDELDIDQTVVSNCLCIICFLDLFLFCFVSVGLFAFTLLRLLNCSYFNPQAFFTCFSDSPSHLTLGGGERVSCCVELSCQLG